MKKNIFLLFFLCISFTIFAQDTEAPTTPTNFQFPFYNSISGPQSTTIEWEHATDNVGVTQYEVYLNGEYLETLAYDGSDVIQSKSFSGLTNGMYCYKIRAKDDAGNSSDFTNEICFIVNCAWCVPDPTDLYISGYLNFSGDNKALEITNLTASDIDLSSYSLKISHNGATTWSTFTYTFPQNTMLLDEDTYIIAHSNISMCSNVIDDYNDTLISFDGNDIIGLFKNDVLIDIIGELGTNATVIEDNTFLKVVTMINEGLPNTTYNPYRWHGEINASNTCPTQLGYAVLYVLTSEEFEKNSFQIYPNPITGDIVHINTKNNAVITTVQIYDMTGKQVLQQANPSNEINVQGLQKGMYILQLKIGSKMIIKKLIKQ